MKLEAHVNGRSVGILESVGDFKSVFTYHSDTAPENFVSLTMPVRTESYVWNDSLHPIFQMNLPEGYLLQALQEEFGPHIGASPTALLAIIGRNMVGRTQLAAPGAALERPAQSVEVADILKGDNNSEAFARLVKRHLTSGVSGVVPKFLSVHWKATLVTGQHIIKGSSPNLPYVALNEHLCMQVAAKVMPTARTEVSSDGLALVVHRFDVDSATQSKLGMEDFCVLLGMRPAAKYETTYERVAKAIRDHVEGNQRESFMQLTRLLLLTHALRNADAHAKNIALLYSRREDVRLAPAYDVITTSVYDGFELNPPALMFAGKKTWATAKPFQQFIAATFNVSVAHQKRMVEQISDAMADVAPQVLQATRDVPGFREIGTRMLLVWRESIKSLRKDYALTASGPNGAWDHLTTTQASKSPRDVIGRSDLLAKR